MSDVQDFMMVSRENAAGVPISFVVYERADGRIVQSGMCPPDDFPLQQLLHDPAQRAVMRGACPNIDDYVVRDGAIVPRDPEEN